MVITLTYYVAMLTARGGAVLPRVGHLAKAILLVPGGVRSGEVCIVERRGERGDLGAARVSAHRVRG